MRPASRYTPPPVRRALPPGSRRRMYFSRSVLVLGCALFLAGCENTSGAFHPRPAMSVEGFSFMPPQGEGWTVSDTRVRDGRAVTFTRADGPVLQVRTWRTSQRYRGQDGLRVEASGWRAGLAFDSAPAGLAGADCLSYRSYWTDETGGTPLDHERHGIMCWNPNDPNRLFDLSLNTLHPLPVIVETNLFVCNRGTGYLRNGASPGIIKETLRQRPVLRYNAPSGTP